MPLSCLPASSPKFWGWFLNNYQSSFYREVLLLLFYLLLMKKYIKGMHAIHQLTFTTKIRLLNVLKAEKTFPKYMASRRWRCKVDMNRASLLCENRQLLSLPYISNGLHWAEYSICILNQQLFRKYKISHNLDELTIQQHF